MIPLPPHKHIPGQTPRHNEDQFTAICALALSPTETLTAKQNQPWLYGIRLFATGYYWEAHEVWEPVWLNARPNSAERFMCQAVIQVANAALKRNMGKAKAALRLCEIADGLLARACGSDVLMPMGIAPLSVTAATSQIRQDLETGRPSQLALRYEI